jgi:hypothetical protein
MGPYEVLQLLEALQAYVGKRAELCVDYKASTGAAAELSPTAVASGLLNLCGSCRWGLVFGTWRALLGFGVLSAAGGGYLAADALLTAFTALCARQRGLWRSLGRALARGAATAAGAAVTAHLLRGQSDAL